MTTKPIIIIESPTTETQTNKHGFPIVACYRCGGSGRYSFNQIDGDRCYGCGGTGWAIQRGKAAKAWNAFQKAMPKKDTTVGNLTVGARVLSDLGYRANGTQQWATVTRIEVTPERCGSLLVGTDEAYRIYHYYLVVTLSNGLVKKVRENDLVRRAVTADMVPDPRDYWPGK